MLSKNKLYWIFQIGGWSTYAAIVGIFNVLANGSTFTLELVFSLLAILLIVIIVSHTYRKIINKLNWMNLNVLQLIPRLLLGTLLSGIAVYILKSLIIERLIVQNAYEFTFKDAFPSIVSSALLFLIWSLLYFLFHYVSNYKKEEIKNLKWQAAKNEIELNKLKSQLNPHFIFNSMNSIRALVDESPVNAKNAITQLSNVLRNSLLMGKKKLIPLGDEMKLVNDYLGLEKTRFEERLTIIREINKTSESFLVPPLMIQTLVENGIKHGTSKLPKGGILKIVSEVKSDTLTVVIYNCGVYDENLKTETGFGIVNTKQRLQLIYGDKAQFSIKNIDGMVETQLTIPNETIL